MNVRGCGHLYRPRYTTTSGERKTAGVWWWKLSRMRVSTGCRTEEDAQRWVLEHLVEMRRGHLVGVKAAPPTWNDLEKMLLDRWSLDGRAGMMQSQARLRHLRRAFAGWHVDAITTDRITAYAVRRRGEGAAAGTINLELAMIRRAFTLAHEAGRLGVVPVIHRLPGARRRTGTIQRGDLDAILAQLAPRYRPIIEALWWTGWREGEILGLTWQRVDLVAQEMRLDTSKSGEPRVLSFAAVAPLRTLLAEAHTHRTFSPYVWPGRAGRRMDRTGLQKAWRAACRMAACPTLYIHDIRRTAVTDLRRAGVALAVAQTLVGHRDLRTHQGYSIVARQDQDAALAQLVALRAGEPVQRRFAVIDQ